MVCTSCSLYLSPSFPLHHYTRPRAIVDARTGVHPVRPFQKLRERHALKQQISPLKPNSDVSSKPEGDAAKRL